jgi:hypothetical protein
MQLYWFDGSILRYASCTAGDAVDWLITYASVFQPLMAILSRPIGIDPAVLGIFSYTSIFYLDYDISRGSYAIGHLVGYARTSCSISRALQVSRMSKLNLLLDSVLLFTLDIT